MIARNKLPVLVVGGLLLLMVLAGVLWWKTPRVTTPIKRGFPNTLAQLNAWYAEPPEGQNAATFFVQGFDAMQITDADQADANLPNIGKGTWPPLGRSLPANVKTATAQFLQRNQAAWEFFKKAMGYDECRYPIDFNVNFGTPLPHLANLKKAAQMSDLKAIMLADSRQSGEATDALLISHAAAQSLQKEPLLISQLVRVACFAMEEAALERMLNSIAISTADLNRLSIAIASAEAEESAGAGFTRGWAGERAGILTVLSLPRPQLERYLKQFGAIDPGPAAAQAQSVKKMTENVGPQRAFAEETFNHLIVMRQQPFPDRLKSREYFTERQVQAKAKGFYICAADWPGLEKIILREARGLAETRLMQAAIALEQNRSANGGKYTDSLASLSPEFLPVVPSDPFDGQPLRYRKTAHGYLLYSIGQDLKDDGGKRESDGKGDLVFEIVNASH